MRCLWKKEEKVVEWLRSRGKGHRFKSRDLAYATKLTPFESGRICAILESENRGVRSLGRTGDGAVLWEVCG